MPKKPRDPKTLRGRPKRFANAVIKWEKENPRDLPWRKDRKPYNVLVTEVLLKRTTSTAAKRVYRSFLKKFPNIAAISRAREKEVELILRPIGLYKQRSRGLKEIAGFIKENVSGKIPAEFDSLLGIPHIGPYTAGAILSFGYGIPAPIVDSNVSRLIRRVFGDILGNKHNNNHVREFLLGFIPRTGHELFNWGLIDLGSLVCSYRSIRCNECPVKRYCDYWYSS